MGAFITYAMNVDEQMVHVDSVPIGNKCGCHCPHCNGLLYAKNGGKKREHHFAHASGHECDGAYESSVHHLAKQVLLESGVIMLPETEKFDYPSGLVELHNIEVEKWDERYKIRPDVEGVMNNGERLLIEFNFAHKVDYNKHKIIVENNLKCIEIDVKYQAEDKNELKDFLIDTAEDRHWLVEYNAPTPPKDDVSFSYPKNPIFGQVREILKAVFDEKTIMINPKGYGPSFDLKQWGYNICEIATKYRGFKTDLLLYRSQKEDKGYIAINVRGRRRVRLDKPKNLRLIDVVINTNWNFNLDFFEQYFIDGVLKDDDEFWRNAVKIYYYDFKIDDRYRENLIRSQFSNGVESIF